MLRVRPFWHACGGGGDGGGGVARMTPRAVMVAVVSVLAIDGVVTNVGGRCYCVADKNRLH